MNMYSLITSSENHYIPEINGYKFEINDIVKINLIENSDYYKIISRITYSKNNYYNIINIIKEDRKLLTHNENGLTFIENRKSKIEGLINEI
jgi:hypothetical protein